MAYAGHHGKGEHDERHMPVPASARTGFVVVWPKLNLSALEAILDDPAAALDLDQLVGAHINQIPYGKDVIARKLRGRRGSTWAASWKRQILPERTNTAAHPSPGTKLGIMKWVLIGIFQLLVHLWLEHPKMLLTLSCHIYKAFARETRSLV